MSIDSKKGKYLVPQISSQFNKHVVHTIYFPGGSDGKASVYNAGDLGSIPESGRLSGEGNGNPLQYSCLENPVDREACCPCGRKESDTTE